MVDNIRNPELLKILMKVLVENVSSSVSFEEFSNHLKALSKSSLKKQLYEIQKEKLISDVSAEIEQAFQNTNIQDKYNELTKQIEECNTNTVKWRPETGDCDQQLLPQRLEIYQKQKLQLQQMIQKERVQRLHTKIMLDEKRNEMKLFLKQMQNADASLKSLQK